MGQQIYNYCHAYCHGTLHRQSILEVRISTAQRQLHPMISTGFGNASFSTASPSSRPYYRCSLADADAIYPDENILQRVCNRERCGRCYNNIAYSMRGNSLIHECASSLPPPSFLLAFRCLNRKQSKGQYRTALASAVLINRVRQQSCHPQPRPL